jgi:hypothetical protein
VRVSFVLQDWRSVNEALIEELRGTLTRRPRPEDVAVLCACLLEGRLGFRDRIVIGRATRHSELRPGYGAMMLSDWEQPVGTHRLLSNGSVAGNVDVSFHHLGV